MESTLSLFSVITERTFPPAPNAAPSRIVAGPRRARTGAIAAAMLAIGLPGVAFGATSLPTDTGSVLTLAPDTRGSASQLRISQVLPPAGVVPAAQPATSGPSADKSDEAAQPPAKKWQVELGLGFAAQPKYPGSGQISAIPVPLLSVTYDNTFFVSSRQGIGAYLIQVPHFRLGASIGIATDTRYTGKDARLRGLPKIKPGGLATLFAAYDLGPITVEAAVHERIGPVNGVSATLGTTYRIRLTPDWSVMAGPELKIQSASLNDAFFGVTPAASLRAASYGNKISPYRPGAGLESVSGTIASRYRLSDHWTLMGKAGLGVLVGRDGSSPLTRQKLQPELGLLAMYRF
jgi:outer membrane scaffolding protein for murein synthesis (MipA/OmpV family)